MLTDRQIQAIDLLVWKGIKKIEVARQLEITPETVSRWFRNEEFVKEYQKEMTAYHQELVQQATQVYVELLQNAQSESVRAAIAKDMISRGGYDAPIRQEITQKTIVVGVEDGNENNIEKGDIQPEIPTISDELPE